MSDAVELRQGLTVHILRPHGGDYSLNGISARYHEAVIVGIRVALRSSVADRELEPAAERGLVELPRIFGANEHRAEVELVIRALGGGIYVHAEPTEGKGRWAMFGGAYIETSDSRFGEILRAIYGDGRYQVGPIPLHDRYEH